MKPSTKHILWAIGAAIGVYALYCVYKAFVAGEKTLAGLLAAPFTSLSSVGKAISNFFSSTGTPSASVPTITPLTPAQAATPGGAFVVDNSPVPISTSPTIATVFNTLPDGSPISWN